MYTYRHVCVMSLYMGKSVCVSASVFVHVSVCDNYLVCLDASAEIFLCLSSAGASSAARLRLCSYYRMLSFLVVFKQTVIKISMLCYSVTPNVSCNPAHGTQEFHLSTCVAKYFSKNSEKESRTRILFLRLVSSHMVVVCPGSFFTFSDSLRGLFRCDSMRSVKSQDPFCLCRKLIAQYCLFYTEGI